MWGLPVPVVSDTQAKSKITTPRLSAFSGIFIVVCVASSVIPISYPAEGYGSRGTNSPFLNSCKIGSFWCG
jgi:hypothetical protein